MSEYKGIKGFQVQTRTEDPAPFAQAIADNPYAGSWSSGGNLNTARSALGSTGSLTAAIGFGGDIPGSPYIETKTERYDGSSWTEVNDLNTGRSAMGAAGTYTAAIGASGYSRPAVTALVESWDGSNWTEIADVNTARYLNEFSVGTQTAALVFQGYSPALGAIAQNVEQWNGSSWTEVAEFNTSRRIGGGFGTSTAALAISGLTPAPSNVANVESWNGSAWTETSDVNTARHNLASTSTPYTTGIVFGGNDNLSVTESWDGSSWTEVADMATARTTTGAGTSAQSALAIGGYTGSFTAATEEWTFSGIQPTDPAAAYADAIVGDFYYNSTTGQFKTVNDGGAPIGTWASGGALNTAKQENFGNGAGTQTAAAVAGGYTTTNSTNHEQYDGTSWTETTEINTGRYGSWADGTQPAFWMAGGYSTTVVNNTETWNGSSWTEVNELNTSRAYGGGTTGRSLTAGLVVSGYTTTNVNNVEQWDGTNWTEVSEVNTARRKAGGFGTSTSAFAMGAAPSPSAPATNLVESWDGTSWTETTEFNTGRGAVGAAGTTTDGLIYGSEQTPRQITESWNGTTWTEVADMGANQGNSAGAGGTATSAWIAGGTNGSTGVTNTEEWTAADFQIKSVTTS